MIQGKPVAVEVEQHDRSFRSGRVWIGAKNMPLHTMCILITRNRYDRQARMDGSRRMAINGGTVCCHV